MSDSDELPNNVFTFQNENTTVSARGPNINASNIGFSFRSNALTSTMLMPRNFERQRYAESSYDQRSMYHRRDTSPMSMHSACDARARNIHNSYYPGGMSSQRSIVNGRSGSPMSFRSIETTASVSAADIAMAFKNVKFNKYDLRVIKDAYNKFMKSRVRKRIEKRRNLRLFLKGTRRRSGYDSGEQGSDSSISSDDCRSIKTDGYKESIPSCISTKTDFTGFRKTMQECNMYKDCTENVRQTTFRNIVTVGRETINMSNSQNGIINMSNLQNRTQNYSTTAQKDRFRNGFLLPSQRFNRSVAASAIPENMERKDSTQHNMNVRNRSLKPGASATCETDSEQEEIFAETIVKKGPTYNIEIHHKRKIDSDDICLPERKRCKVSPINKDNIETQSNQPNVNAVSNINDFVFAKPSCPLKKTVNGKTREKLISKSSQPLVDNTLSKQISDTLLVTSDQKVDQVHKDELEIIQNPTSDVSMRPSFIKRKLFTQKLDVTEKKNISCCSDSQAANSPQTNVYSAMQMEKHKARKLVTQSCLRRDIQDENNLMDLIHKIVPPDRMNVTNQTNKTEVHIEKNNSEDLEDKWDVTSIISTCNIDNVSDTYTDEEILEAGNNSIKSKENISMKPLHTVKILVEKLPANVIWDQESRKSAMEKNHFMKKHVDTKSFWDTDFESDFECQNVPHLNSDLKENYTKANNLKGATSHHIKNHSNVNKSVLGPDTTKPVNNTVESVQKLNITNLKIRSHRAPKRKKCCIELPKPDENKPAVFEPQIKQHTTKHNIKNTAKTNNNILNRCNALDSTLSGAKNIDTEAVLPKNNKKKMNTKSNTKVLNEKDSAVSSSKNNNVETAPENKTKRKQSTKNKAKATNPLNKSYRANSIINSNYSATDHGNINTRKLNALEKTKSNNLSNKHSTYDATNDVSIETDHERSGRPLRSCRTSKQNKTLDASNIYQSTSNSCSLLSRSLRSRQIDLSSCFAKEKCTDKNKKKLSPNTSKVSNKTIQTKLRQSEVSFSLVSDKKSALINKKAITNKTGLANSWVCNKEIELSDVSFSITANKESPLAKTSANKGTSRLAKNNAKMGKNTILSNQSDETDNKYLLNTRQRSEMSINSSRRIMLQNQNRKK